MNGKQLKISIKKKGLTQQEAAKILGVSRQTFNSWCKLMDLPEDMIRNVKTFLDVDLEADEAEMLKNPAENLVNSTKDSTFIPNSYSGLTDEQIEKEIEDVIMKKLLKMYQDGLIYSAASVKEYQQQIAELMNENARLGVEVDRLHQQLEKQQESKQFKEEASKPTR